MSKAANIVKVAPYMRKVKRVCGRMNDKLSFVPILRMRQHELLLFIPTPPKKKLDACVKG